jgi:hypothetical protein
MVFGGKLGQQPLKRKESEISLIVKKVGMKIINTKT